MYRVSMYIYICGMCYVGGWLHGVSGMCMVGALCMWCVGVICRCERVYSGCGFYWACSSSDISSINIHSSLVSVCCMFVQSVCNGCEYVGV